MSDKALIERLRNAADRKWPDPNVARFSLFAEAADTIARLTAERDAARREAMEECARICDTTPPYPFRASIEAAHAIRAVMREGEGK